MSSLYFEWERQLYGSPSIILSFNWLNMLTIYVATASLGIAIVVPSMAMALRKHDYCYYFKKIDSSRLNYDYVRLLLWLHKT